MEDFRKEVATMRFLSHPNIVQFFGAYLQEQPFMLINEFMPGGSLEKLQENKVMLSQKKTLKYARDVAAGMTYLHSYDPPVIHRDLKPGNLLLDRCLSASHRTQLTSGFLLIDARSLLKHLDLFTFSFQMFSKNVCKICDFGLARVRSRGDATKTYSMTGETGSYRYMAPEVFRHAKYNEKVDQYSFAIVVWEMLEGTMYLPYLKAIDVAYSSEAGHRYTIRLIPF